MSYSRNAVLPERTVKQMYSAIMHDRSGVKNRLGLPPMFRIWPKDGVFCRTGKCKRPARLKEPKQEQCYKQDGKDT